MTNLAQAWRDSALLRRYDAMVIARVNRWLAREHPELVKRLRKFKRDQTGRPGVNIALPQSLNEKFAWRKVFDHDPRFTVLSDKVACKDWVAGLGLDVKLPRTLWVGDDATQIPGEVFATPSIIKGRHGSKMNIFLREPPADRAAVIAEAAGFVAKRHGAGHHQWGYFDVPSGLIAEELVFGGKPCFDVKIYTFGREISQIVPIHDRDGERVAALWRMGDDGVLRLSDEPSAVSKEILRLPLPDYTDEMMAIAAEIGAHFDHMRVDFLCGDDDFYLGELTVYNQTGKYARHGFERDFLENRLWDIRRAGFFSAPLRGWRRVYRRSLRRALDRIAAEG